MFTRKDALELLASKFKHDSKKKLDSFIDLHEPTLDGLKEGGKGLTETEESIFLRSVDTAYKNENGLWR